ncbi:Per1-like-domain-containing protein [Thamnocephalis sphaerospora]|uniref:Post-GPI attachment to proteins factor 3 n=1 Tax=Thamnocephalis sphaerospora TaxID=78915 RepID=A0A4P9XPM3_9FUNG|nr:Per1-like-domain-containing protein [Thamnocephalis sphaerospora]|eukprot:RKP07946.1 Per1-like-domain-containing protein [Thamnocephalis sphaerospora]
MSSAYLRIGRGRSPRTRLLLQLLLGLVFVACLSAPAPVLASEGDRAPEYQLCTLDCEQRLCQQRVGNETIQVNPLPLYMRLLHWTCPDDCRYQCQHSVTAARLERGEPVVQYHGKWPFTRILGVQEPASVLFSLWNGYGHWRYLPVLAGSVNKRYFMRTVLLGYAFVGLNTWLWSAVFHVRDTPLTEKLDYFSAGFGILYGLYMAVCRVLYIRNMRTRRVLMAIFGALFTAHILYLTLDTRFDYAYNIAACATVGMLHNLIWCAWAARNWRTRPYAWQVVALVVCVTSAMMLELFDFPPLGWLVDAHALWHAATALLVPWWYRFLLADYAWETSEKNASGSRDALLVNRTQKLKD